MIQNLKVDIIYHLTPSDFEMEFNLCGCCRTRLLNDKTTDKKTFIKALARAVSRSRIIMVCGPLFNDDGLIKTVATAIGSTTSACNNSTYGIKSDDKIEIINGSTPLVTADGYFGGCIIESGPQTIILLTENRNFRKSIMQNLIHPYVEEISYIPTKTTAYQPKVSTQEPETTVGENEAYITEKDDTYAQEDAQIAYEPPTASDENNIEFIMDEESALDDEPLETLTPVDEAFNNMYTEIESEQEIKERYKKAYVPSKSDEMFLSTPEYDEPEPQKTPKDNSKGMDITIVILALLLLLAILALVYFVVLKPMTIGISSGEYIKEIFGLASNNSLV